MLRGPPRLTLTDTLLPYAALCRSPDDAADRLAPALQAFAEAAGDRLHRVVESAKGQQRAGEDAFDEPAEGSAGEQGVQQGAQRARAAHHGQREEATQQDAPAARQVLAIQQALEAADRAAEQDHRMRHDPRSEE